MAASALLWAAGGAAMAQPKVPTIEQLAAFPRMASFTVSPDGKHMAAVEARGEEQVVLVWDTADLRKKPSVLGAKNMKIQAVDFLKNDVLAVSMWQPYDLKVDPETRKTFTGMLMLTDLEGKSWREPMQRPRPIGDQEKWLYATARPSVLDALPNDPDHFLLSYTLGISSADIYKVNVRNGRAERIQRGDEKTASYITDLEGNLRARTRVGTDATGAYISSEVRSAKGDWEEIARAYAKDREIFTFVGFSKDPNIAYILSNRGRDKAAIYEYDIAARKLGALAFEHKFFDASGVQTWPIKDEHFGELIGFDYEGPRSDEVLQSDRIAGLKAALDQALEVKPTPITYVDPATGAKANTTYPVARYSRLISYSNDLNTVVAWVGGPNDPGAYYLLKNKKELSLLSKPHPDLDPAALGSSTLVYYKARDGLDIPAFLTTPSKALYGEGPWPTVIMPHGGPWARDHLEWDWSMWPQLLASRGYAVLQPQYRATADGWGKKLWMAGDREWGGKMQDDKDDGAKWLIDTKVAKPGHIAMFGFSYGGYAAMDAAVRPNGIYKCAIAGAGVSDIGRIWKDFYTNPYFRDSQEPTVRGVSPLDFADKISIPIMVYHGVRDRTVPIEQSEWFVKKAKAAGKDVEYHEFVDYAHGPAWTRDIFGQQLKIIDDYFKTGCGGSGL
ncbi:MAG: prolyl oligopeptidase family serine peptidase [Caulobacter sp.]